jgi:ubiquinol-cytochrome c reductase cytochrome c subunit
MRTLAAAAASVIALSVGSMAQTPRPPAAPAQTQAPAGRADAGRTLFAKVGCYQCHSNEAQGGAAGPRLGPGPTPYARFVSYIRKPAGEMPPYSAKVLSDRDLADIYAFLQALPKPPAVADVPLLRP